jgi:hypothetical protein
MSHYPNHVMRRVIGKGTGSELKNKNGNYNLNLKVNQVNSDAKINNFSFDDQKYVNNKKK